MRPCDQATNRLSTVNHLDQICIRPDEYRVARTSLRQAELLAVMFMRAYEDLRHVFGLVARGFSALPRRSNVCAVTPEWRLP